MLLWFAWKIVLLQYRKQLLNYSTNKKRCCDLLEKSYFCSIANNAPQFCSSILALWFAWKIVLLQYRKQLRRIYVLGNVVVICLKNRTFAVSQTTAVMWGSFAFGCDLLEKSYFCSIANNAIAVKSTKLALWFAWKIVLLQYRKQHTLLTIWNLVRCDLLEKSYFCSIANNLQAAYNPN